MIRRTRRTWATLLLAGSLALLVPAGSLRAQAEQDEDEGSGLAAKSQNPVGDLISVPFQQHHLRDRSIQPNVERA